MRIGEYTVLCYVAPNWWSCRDYAPYIGYCLALKEGVFQVFFIEDTVNLEESLKKEEKHIAVETPQLDIALQILETKRKELSEEYKCIFEIKWLLMPYDCEYWEVLFRPKKYSGYIRYKYGIGRINENWFIWQCYCYDENSCEPMEIIECSTSKEHIEEKIRELEALLSEELRRGYYIRVP